MSAIPSLRWATSATIELEGKGNKGVGNLFCNRARRKLVQTFRFS